MDTDGMLVEQAKRNKIKNPTAKVFVYRNIVKVGFTHNRFACLRCVYFILRWCTQALPWYTQVRKFLQGRNYWGWCVSALGAKIP